MGKKRKKTDDLYKEEGKGKGKKKKKTKSPKTSQNQASTKGLHIDPAKRYEMIATAAYYLAEKHGFDPQKSTQDWEQAEREIDSQLGRSTLG